MVSIKVVDDGALNAVSKHPLLFLDGHSSQCHQYAWDHDVIIFCLPPHTKHECQPLHSSLFGPLK